MGLYIELLDYITIAVDIIAVVILVFGVVRFVVSFFSSIFSLQKKGITVQRLIQEVRMEMSSIILLALEVLVIADILKTIYEPKFQDILRLASIVAIRTVISLFEHFASKGEAAHGKKQTDENKHPN